MESRRKEEGLRLCITTDPDSPCDTGINFARKVERDGS